MAKTEDSQKKNPKSGEADKLRQRAERLLDDIVDAYADADSSTPTREGLAEAVHELRVHQIELETQNEELRQAQIELDEQREKYFDLFDRAPVGYLIIDSGGKITSANLTASSMLGVERQILVGSPLSAFVLTEDRDTYYLHTQAMKKTFQPQTFEVRLVRVSGEADVDGGHFWALFESVPRRAADGELSSSLVAFTDISKKMRAEALIASRSRIAEYAVYHSLDEVIQCALDELETITRSKIGFFHWVDEDQESLTLQTWSTKTLASQCTAKGQGDHYAISDAGVWADCVREGHPIVHNDYSSVPNKRGLPVGHAVLVRELTVPVLRGGMARIILGVGNKRTNYDKDDLDAVVQLADLTYDIIVAKKSENVLRKSERLLDLSQRVAQVGNYHYDIVKDHWDGSATLNEVLGVDADHDAGLDGWLATVHPADRERMARYFTEDILEKGQSFDMDYRVVRASDGRESWVHGLGAVEYDDDGNAVAMFGTMQDVTDRKLTEIQLARERAVLGRAEAVGHVGSWRIELDGGSTMWSPQAVSILGFDPSVEQGDPLEKLRAAIHPDDRAAFEHVTLESLVAEKAQFIDFRIVRPDGEARWIGAQGALEIDENNGPVVMTGVILDITDRKLAEDERIGRFEQVANIDTLTGLNNRRGFDVLAAQAIALAERADQGVGLIFCDMDGLKEINDEYGHAQGDQALRDVAAILKSTLRTADAIARIGGDEFIILAVDGRREAIAHLDERVQESITAFNATQARPYTISLSSGTAWCDSGVDCQLEAIKAVADTAMYAEKLKRRGGARNV